MTDPVKERILIQVVKNLVAMSDDDGAPFFQFVERNELDPNKQHQGFVCGVIDGEENYVYQTCYLQCIMTVGFDIAVKVKKGDKPSQLLGLALAELKKVLLSNTNLIEEETNAQLCENVQIRDYLPDPAGPNDNLATAFAHFDFIYRENKENPYQLM